MISKGDIIQKMPLVARDITRVKKKTSLYFRLFKIETYKIISFYRIRKSRLNYPTSLQLPITNKCNLDCVMCNIQAKKEKLELSLVDFQQMLKDPIFKKIIAVGVNGGEPFIVKDLAQRIQILVDTLPSLKSIYIISNGTLTYLIEQKLKQIKKTCEIRNVRLIVSISIDGIGSIHDKIRNRRGTFKKAINTIEMIQCNKSKFCDYLNIICTVSKYNVYNLNAIDVYAKNHKWNISYNIATVHERLCNEVKIEDFSLFVDEEARMLAQEFFYRKLIETKSEMYYSVFSFLRSKGEHRPCYCVYLKSGITVIPEGEICYCATHSDCIGNIKEGDIKKIYFGNEKYNRSIRSNYCEYCSHYMMGGLYVKDYVEYVKIITAPWQNYRL